MWKKIFSVILISIFGIGLGLYAFLGIYSRLFTDDYCYNYYYNSIGLINTLSGYYFIGIFTAHRFSLTFFGWFINLFGKAGIQLIPLFVILLLWLGTYQLITSISNRINLSNSTVRNIIISLFLVYFSLYLAPNIYQSLYWRIGVLPYTAPLICGIWLFVYLLRKQPFRKPIKDIVMFLAAFISAGFSESGAVFIAAIMSIMISWSIWSSLTKNNTWREIGRPAMAGLTAIVIALIIMYLSPMNQGRIKDYQAPASFWYTILLSIKFTVDFLWLSLKTQPVPNLVFILISFGLSVYFTKNQKINFQNLLLISGGTLFSALLILSAIHIPSAFIEKSPPADRTLIMARFVVLCMFLVISWATGMWFSAYQKKFPLRFASVCIILIGVAYVLRSEYKTFSYLQPRYFKVAHVWDDRDNMIKKAILQKREIVEVRPIDSQYIGDLLEFYPSPNWVNICAADYYGIKEIWATLDW